VAFVVSLNLKRRHLTSSQKAVVALAVEKQLAVEARKQQGRRNDLLQRIEKGGQPLHAAQQASTLLGTNRQYVLDAKRIERQSPTLLEEVRRGSLTIPEAKKLVRLPLPEQARALELVQRGDARTVVDSVRKLRLAAQVEAVTTMQLPKGTYHVLVSDPPWPYAKRMEDTTHRGTIPYPSMTIQEIAELPVQKLAHTDCILWLWTTNAFMAEAYQVAQAWGFTVKTILTWDKQRMGLGDWLRGQTEHCLLAVRGKPVVALRNQTTLLHGTAREHSRKPEEFYALVESLCPGSKCELFARNRRPGWNSYGAEVEMFAG
jgi:N6-adenosine-specific RNA methylase IME4